ncbi:MAG: hypothetical protein SFX18_11000 [Pirellulales bacterium]|nr:hypothetical protein [Pirellulales bacterium]
MVAQAVKAEKNNHNKELSADQMIDQGKKMTEDLLQYMHDYAKENPGTAALWCLGVGFILGWKLKPW